MTKCKQCNITISDDTNICPLCRCAVEPGSDAAEQASVYPAVWIKERRLKHICNISLFGVLLISAVLAVCNYAFYEDHLWSIIPIASMVYAWTVFRLVIISQKGYRSKMLVPILFAIILMVIIDIETGFYRWSLNFVLPAGVLLVDVIIIMLMLTNMRNWHSYIIMQIGMMAVSIVPMALWGLRIITSPVMTLIAACVSLFIFLGTIIVGDRTARSELKRRFHIR